LFRLVAELSAWAEKTAISAAGCFSFNETLPAFEWPVMLPNGKTALCRIAYDGLAEESRNMLLQLTRTVLAQQLVDANEEVIHRAMELREALIAMFSAPAAFSAPGAAAK
jgi:hypothetical protein